MPPEQLILPLILLNLKQKTTRVKIVLLRLQQAHN